MPPLLVSISSNPPTGSIITAGSTITLTCTVELSQSVDVPVAVSTMWTGPDNFNIVTQQMGSTTTYTSTVMVSSFGRNQSGDYTCIATVNSTSQFIMASSPPSRVTVGRECMSGLLSLEVL